MNTPIFSVSDFVAVFNQTLEFAYPSVTIVGELANFKINKNQWLRFSLKDDNASVNFFGTKFQLPGPVQEGMLLKVIGYPRLHPLYGFSVNIQSIAISGEGSIKKAYQLLESKLQKEGLFDEARKRAMLYPPAHIGLITSVESAAFVDFCKVLNARWGGADVELYDVQVQGEVAASQIQAAIEYFNAQADPPDVVVLTRGGGSSDDLQVFNSEPLVRALAASRVPTLAAIGHEIDLTLAERVSDKRASTPSNAAEILVPDRKAVLRELQFIKQRAESLVEDRLKAEAQDLTHVLQHANNLINAHLSQAEHNLQSMAQLITALNPAIILKRGYAVVRDKVTNKAVKSSRTLKAKQAVNLEFSDGSAMAVIEGVK